MEKEHVGKITTITHTLRKISRWNKVIIPQHLLQFALFFDCGTCWLCHSGLPKVNQHVACRSWMPHFPYFAICDLPLKVTAPWPDHTPGHICATQISCTRKQSNTDRGWWPESRGAIVLWARHAHIDQVTGWLSDKQTGSPMLIMQICRPNWFAAEEADQKWGRLLLATVSAGWKTKRGVCAISTTKLTAKCMQISDIYMEGRRHKTEGIRHTPRKQYSEVLGAKLKRNWKYII